MILKNINKNKKIICLWFGLLSLQTQAMPSFSMIVAMLEKVCVFSLKANAPLQFLNHFIMIFKFLSPNMFKSAFEGAININEVKTKKKKEDLLLNDQTYQSSFLPKVLQDLLKEESPVKTDTKLFVLKGHTGAGKSLFVKYFASQHQKNLYEITAAFNTGNEKSFVNNVNLLLHEAERDAQKNGFAVVLFDEIDSFFAGSDDAADFINCIHGYADRKNKNSNVFIFLTQNFVKNEFEKQGALIRPGRFSEVNFVREACNIKGVRPELASFFNSKNDFENFNFIPKMQILNSDVFTELLRQKIDLKTALYKTFHEMRMLHLATKAMHEPYWTAPKDSFLAYYEELLVNHNLENGLIHPLLDISLAAEKNRADAVSAFFKKFGCYAGMIGALQEAFTRIVRENIAVEDKKIANFLSVSYLYEQNSWGLKFCADEEEIRIAINLITPGEMPLFANEEYKFENPLADKSSLAMMKVIAKNVDFYRNVYLLSVSKAQK